MTQLTSPIHRAVEIAGGDEVFKEKIGVGRRLLYYWKSGRKPSVDYVLKIEELTGVSRHDLRPDLWPAASAASSDGARAAA